MPSVDGLRGDVLVIGGGPAGLAASIALRMRGLTVAVADARRPPIDSACGEGILPAGIAALEHLGVPLDASDGLPFRGIRFLEAGASVEAPFSSAHGVGIRRTRLHQLLVGRASQLGVRLLWGTSVASTSDLSGYAWVVGADGQHSRVRHSARLDGAMCLSRRFGFRRHYRLSPWTDMVEVHWGAGCQFYVTPVAPDEIGVALLTRDSHRRIEDAVRDFPALQRRLKNVVCTSSDRGSVTTTRRLRRVFRDRTALIGDASGSVDAIAGEGLSLAFLQAIALSDAIAAGDLRPYQAKHRQLGRSPLVMANLLLMLDRCAWARPLIWKGLAFEPSILGRMVSLYAPAGLRQLL
ncbi:MAG: NAD(P)/FAD-dependent oxidoreductase [Ignavibacteriota bacterium]